MNATATTSPQPARASLGWAALRLQSDDELGSLVRDGYEQAFDAVVERHRAALLRYATTLVGPDRAEDVVQQAFEKALNHLRHDERELALRAWLYRVCHNLSINVLQRKGADYEQLDENYDGVPQPPDVFERGQNLRSVFKQVRGLPDRQRSALMLSAVGDMSYEQIANDMHVTPPVVRQLLYRARSTLRDALGAVVPAPVIRLWLSGASPDHSQIAELVAGGGAGAGVVKAGAAVLAASVVATGAGVTASHRQQSQATPSATHHAAPPAGGTAGSGTSAPGAAPGHRSGEHSGGGPGHGRDDSGGSGGSGGGDGGSSGGGSSGESEPGHGHGGSGSGGGEDESGGGQSGSGDGGSGGGEPGDGGGSNSGSEHSGSGSGEPGDGSGSTPGGSGSDDPSGGSDSSGGGPGPSGDSGDPHSGKSGGDKPELD
jgi:RNA polymerase sigma factor (sigma-70 family)